MTAPTLPRSRAADLNAEYLPRDVEMAWIRDYFLVTFGNTGAVSSISKSAYSLTRTGTGVYDVIFPKARNVNIKAARIKTAAVTVTGFVVTAYDAQAGTATITFVGGAGVATDPASGDTCNFEIELQTES